MKLIVIDMQKALLVDDLYDLKGLSDKTVKYYNEWIWDNVFAKCLTFNKSLDLLKTK